jgi:hypothetical protein
MTRSTKRAIDKYGIEVCKQAYEMHMEGNGARTVSYEIYVLNNTNAADAAINAGREIAEGLTCEK